MSPLSETPGPAVLVAPELVVATKHAPPADRTGVAVELWQRLADELDLGYRLEEATLEGMVNGTAAALFDAALAALTITTDREQRVDFTFSFYPTGLAPSREDPRPSDPRVLAPGSRLERRSLPAKWRPASG